jgi:hypothetical protein
VNTKVLLQLSSSSTIERHLLPRSPGWAVSVGVWLLLQGALPLLLLPFLLLLLVVVAGLRCRGRSLPSGPTRPTCTHQATAQQHVLMLSAACLIP